MNDNLQLRPEDFRHAWTNALARCMHEAIYIINRLDRAHEKQADIQDRLDFLDVEVRHTVSLISKTNTVLTDSIAASVEQALQRIELATLQSQIEINTSHLQLSQAAAQYIKSMEAERSALARERNAIKRERNALEIEKSTSPWRRFFNRH